jgi:hypothetical protein
MKELTEAFKKAQQVQEGAKKLQEELDVMEIEGTAAAAWSRFSQRQPRTPPRGNFAGCPR